MTSALFSRVLSLHWMEQPESLFGGFVTTRGKIVRNEPNDATRERERERSERFGLLESPCKRYRIAPRRYRVATLKNIRYIRS